MRSILLIVSIFLTSISYSQSLSWIIQLDETSDLKVNNSKHISNEISIDLLSAKMNIWMITSSKQLTKIEVTELLEDKQKIKHIFPNRQLERRNSTPNDFFYEEQWNLNAINIQQAWDQTTGGTDANGNEIVIAILDDGYDINHEDLKDNIWSNQFEIPNDGIDNDNNDYIDDHIGVNIMTGSGIHAGVKHGTQVAGILGARTDNNFGIAGVNWNTKILLISGVSNIGEVIKAMEYIYDLKKAYLDSNGVRGANIVVNNFSGGLRRLFPEDFPSWCYMYELLGQIGILSVGAVANENFDVETEGDMPTLCTSDHLIMCTNTNISNEKVLDAAYGSISVDLGAPGENIISTSIGNDYETISGTSASAPHVAGIVALLHSLPCTTLADISFNNPSESALLIKQAILDGTTTAQSLNRSVSGGVVNAFSSMVELQDLCGTQRSNNLSLKIIGNGMASSSDVLEIEYETTDNSNHRLSIYDLQGRNIYSLNFIPPLFEETKLSVNISNIGLTAGIYLVQIANSEEQITSKLFIF